MFGFSFLTSAAMVALTVGPARFRVTLVVAATETLPTASRLNAEMVRAMPLPRGNVYEVGLDDFQAVSVTMGAVVPATRAQAVIPVPPASLPPRVTAMARVVDVEGALMVAVGTVVSIWTDAWLPAETLLL